MYLPIWLLIITWLTPVPVQPFNSPTKNPSETTISVRYTSHAPPPGGAGCPPRC